MTDTKSKENIEISDNIMLNGICDFLNQHYEELNVHNKKMYKICKSALTISTILIISIFCIYLFNINNIYTTTALFVLSLSSIIINSYFYLKLIKYKENKDFIDITENEEIVMNFFKRETYKDFKILNKNSISKLLLNKIKYKINGLYDRINDYNAKIDFLNKNNTHLIDKLKSNDKEISKIGRILKFINRVIKLITRNIHNTPNIEDNQLNDKGNIKTENRHFINTFSRILNTITGFLKTGKWNGRKIGVDSKSEIKDTSIKKDNFIPLGENIPGEKEVNKNLNNTTHNSFRDTNIVSSNNQTLKPKNNFNDNYDNSNLANIIANSIGKQNETISQILEKNIEKINQILTNAIASDLLKKSDFIKNDNINESDRTSSIIKNNDAPNNRINGEIIPENKDIPDDDKKNKSAESITTENENNEKKEIKNVENIGNKKDDINDVKLSEKKEIKNNDAKSTEHKEALSAAEDKKAKMVAKKAALSAKKKQSENQKEQNNQEKTSDDFNGASTTVNKVDENKSTATIGTGFVDKVIQEKTKGVSTENGLGK
ncbi:hypothetical protein [uncultured Brachyspira sp.]|uniref:hypothetical protein n=1 Tax=uncultured Brachyspira sp. TaxID=221953 RepID=UPI002627F5C7|nr:hypothetical protein [uncultured Brachyspira sp.]